MKKRVLSAALAAMMTASAAVPCAADSAPAVGSVIGSIYSTDILTYVSGASIRGYALDGKTAILVEDLANYGFIVGYDDLYRTLYAFVKTNTYPHEPAEGIERGTVGEITGSIYASDIQTFINGTFVPSFTLDGKTAVAIEDIAADETQEETSKTCMTYKWDGENRTITLKPVYDNTDKIPSGFSISDTGVVTYDKSTYNRSSFAHATAILPDNAYAFPLRFGDENGEIVGKAYASAVTCPDQNETGEKWMRSYTRYIIDWDREKLSSLYDAWAKSAPNPNMEDLKKAVSEKLTQPKVFENEGAIVLADKHSAYVLLKENELYPAQVVNVSDFLANEGMANGIITSPSDDLLYEVTDMYQNKKNTIGLLVTLKDGTNRTLYVQNDGGVYPVHSVMYGTENYGVVYPTVHPRNYAKLFASIKIDGKTLDGEFECLADLGGRSFNVPLKPILDAVGGSAHSKGLTFSITTDGKEHTYSYAVTNNPMQTNSARSFSGLAYSADCETTYLLNGEEFEFLLPVIVGHWENMRTEYHPFSPVYYNGEIYIPIQGLPGFTAENTN